MRADSFFRKMAERRKARKEEEEEEGWWKSIQSISSFVTGNGRRASWIILTKDKTDTANRPCARVNRNLGNGRYTVKYLRRTVEFQKYHHCLPGAPVPMECLIHWERGEEGRGKEGRGDRYNRCDNRIESLHKSLPTVRPLALLSVFALPSWLFRERPKSPLDSHWVEGGARWSLLFDGRFVLHRRAWFVRPFFFLVFFLFFFSLSLSLFCPSITQIYSWFHRIYLSRSHKLSLLIIISFVGSSTFNLMNRDIGRI